MLLAFRMGRRRGLMRAHIAILASCCALGLPLPAHGAVTSSSDVGFAIESSVNVAASPDVVYDLLTMPSRWWSSAHTYSGSAAYLTLDAKAGGCFCEALPAKDGKRAGSVEHARVIHAAPGQMLRLTGALGPLQTEAVVGTLTFSLAAAGSGTRITMSYVVGGYLRAGAARTAPLVDQVLDEQLQGLARAADAR
jgi:uncharacterized protein YndB with AHSA1/START domain